MTPDTADQLPAEPKLAPGGTAPAQGRWQGGEQGCAGTASC